MCQKGQLVGPNRDLLEPVPCKHCRTHLLCIVQGYCPLRRLLQVIMVFLFGKKGTEVKLHGMSIISVIVCMAFLALHTLDLSSMDTYINSHSLGSMTIFITTIHASHVYMVMLAVLLLGIFHRRIIGIIALAYAHLVEVLWLVIMSVTMLADTGNGCTGGIGFSMNVLCTTVSHKLIGMFYGMLGLAGLTWATVCSLIMRFELASPGMRIIMSYDSYNVYVTLHGLIMIFGFAMPVLFGLYGNVLIPLLICSPEVGFAKLNNASYIVYSAAMLLLIEAHLMDILTGLGWTIYPPLSTAGALLVCYGVTLAFVALTVMGFSTTFTAANYLSTMIIRSSNCVIT
jgi:hypothetical protein